MGGAVVDSETRVDFDARASVIVPFSGGSAEGPSEVVQRMAGVQVPGRVSSKSPVSTVI